MIDPKLKVDTKKVDTKEFELPETVFIRDIENKVFIDCFTMLSSD